MSVPKEHVPASRCITKPGVFGRFKDSRITGWLQEGGLAYAAQRRGISLDLNRHRILLTCSRLFSFKSADDIPDKRAHLYGTPPPLPKWHPPQKQTSLISPMRDQEHAERCIEIASKNTSNVQVNSPDVAAEHANW
jgi:hypothetical protein